LGNYEFNLIDIENTNLKISMDMYNMLKNANYLHKLLNSRYGFDINNEFAPKRDNSST